MKPAELSAYYRNVHGYHDLIEEQDRDESVIPPDLLLHFIERGALTLDIGGGSGINAEILGLDPERYVCSDLSFAGLTIAKEKKRGMAVQVDAARLPLHDDSIDIVLCSWSFEHFDKPDQALREMKRVVKGGGRVILWGPNWDNIFRKDFPQFAHKDKGYVRRVRWRIFFKMIKNEFLPFHYIPYVNLDVAAMVSPDRYLAGDTDAVHCVLCQETSKWFRQNEMAIRYMSDFSKMGKYLYNGWMIKTVRAILRPLLPILRHVPLARWFVIRFPIVAEKPR